MATTEKKLVAIALILFFLNLSCFPILILIKRKITPKLTNVIQSQIASARADLVKEILDVHHKAQVQLDDENEKFLAAVQNGPTIETRPDNSISQ